MLIKFKNLEDPSLVKRRKKLFRVFGFMKQRNEMIGLYLSFDKWKRISKGNRGSVMKI
jgi:hypothetical protein